MPDALFRLTDGNPFFVTEVLASPELSVPPTVADAVLARVGKLSPRAQAALEYLAVAPTGFEMPVLSDLVDEMTPIAEAERPGVLRMRGNIVVFRHELARRAVYESMPLQACGWPATPTFCSCCAAVRIRSVPGAAPRSRCLATRGASSGMARGGARGVAGSARIARRRCATPRS